MVDLNWLWILIGTVAIFLAYKVGKQKGKVAGMGKTVPVLFLLLMVGVSAYYSGLYDYVKGEVPVTAVTPPAVVTPPVTTLCAVEDTTVTLSTINKYTAIATGGTHSYRVNGAPALEVSNAGTFTASPGDSLEILWFNASVFGSYYTDLETVTVPCSGTKIYSKELVQNGSITLAVWNEEGVQITGTTSQDAATVNETVGVGDVPTLKAELRGTYQRGHPHGLILVCEYNTTTIDDCIIDFGGSKVDVPDVFKVSHTDKGAKAYSIPALLSNKILAGTITLDVDDAKAAGLNDEEDVFIWTYTKNYYIDEDLGGAFKGPDVEDEDDVGTGLIIADKYFLTLD